MIQYDHNGNTMAFTVGTAEALKFHSDITVFNEGGADVNHRFESNNNDGMLFVDGGTDRVGVGTGTPGGDLEVKMASNVRLVVDDTLASGVTIRSIQDNGTHNHMSVVADNVRFLTNTSSNTAAERMRILSGGSVVFHKSARAFNTVGVEIINGAEPFTVTVDGNYTGLFNRKSDDGDLIRFYRDTGNKGSISVSSETVSYNAFTGSHWSRFTDNSSPTILRGTVMESLDAMVDWYNLEYDITTTTQDEDGNDVNNTETFGVPHVLLDGQSNGDTVTYDHNGTDVQATIVKEANVKHMMSKVSDTTDAKNVYGVWNCYDDENSEEGYNDFLIAAVGTFLVRIKSGQTVTKGNLLQSNGDGTAKVLAGSTSITADVLSTVFAKVLSNTKIETYADGSFIVPCSFTNC
jgi:hypothetical protein